jgi:hypothetical protein
MVIMVVMGMMNCHTFLFMQTVVEESQCLKFRQICSVRWLLLWFCGDELWNCLQQKDTGGSVFRKVHILTCVTSLLAKCRSSVKPRPTWCLVCDNVRLGRDYGTSPAWGWNKRVLNISQITIVRRKPKNHRKKVLQCHFRYKSHMKSPGIKPECEQVL